MPTVVSTKHGVLMRELQCKNCGIVYAVDDFVMGFREESKKAWYCPNGHAWTYSESEAVRVRKQLEQQTLETNRQRENFFAEQRKHEQTTKELKRTKKRVANGVCPCCHRTVSQLSRHMKTKHPEFIAETKTT